MHLVCGNFTTNSFSISWLTALPTLPFGQHMYEAQLGLASEQTEKRHFIPFIATTAQSPSLIASDLLPDTKYMVKMRVRTPWTHQWSNLTTPAVLCSTKPLAPGQPLVLPPHSPPTHKSITVELAKPLPSGQQLLVEARRMGSSSWLPPVAVGTGGLAVISGLQPASAYEVRARTDASVDARAAAPPPSDVVVYRTATPGVGNLTVFRISELCGADPSLPSYTYGEDPDYRRPCEPDMLYNHDSGNLLADVEFITAVSGGGGFVPDFNGSITSRYCVAHQDRPPADYVSCNGRDTEHYRCTCNVFVDRCIGRLDTSECEIVSRRSRSGKVYNDTVCTCSEASTGASAKYIGRMPVYYPFPKFHRPTHPMPKAECVPELVPPANQSIYLGDWYSMPAAGECAADVMPLPGEGGRCTWARRATHHFVHGFQLLAEGFVYGRKYDAETLRHNDKIIERVMARHPVRCCNC